MAGPRRSTDTAVTDFGGPAAPHILVVEARYYDEIADQLLSGATGAIRAAGASFDLITVPGALEVPAAVVIALDAAVARGRPYDGVVTLGCVVRGETTHYEIVSGESARALMEIAVARGLPLGNGILTVENDEQARVRASIAEMNKGGGAAEAALHMVALKRRLYGVGE
ncbi:6,7-dimethyl-8-ribityllumazine synthase [Labrys wisconsinensis]|uniref:6,7-dimethyl-8-ribityllumazine synthase n=1 Tax=Labrys wisconsinensis TaxID=425677 RepID=UPI003522BDFD